MANSKWESPRQLPLQFPSTGGLWGINDMNKVKYLLTYRYAEIIHDLTVEFTKTYVLSSLSGLSHLRNRPDFRTADQMNQAARSGKQNIVEGVGQSNTSIKGLIKLLGV